MFRPVFGVFEEFRLRNREKFGPKVTRLFSCAHPESRFDTVCRLLLLCGY